MGAGPRVQTATKSTPDGRTSGLIGGPELTHRHQRRRRRSHRHLLVVGGVSFKPCPLAVVSIKR